jgi:hypothetical protein
VVAPNDAPALADVAPAPPGNCAARLPDTLPVANEPASISVFSTHTCTNTSTLNDTSTLVNVPNAGSNASRLSDPAPSNATVALAESPTVAAEPTPDGTSAATEAIDAATKTRRAMRCQPHVSRRMTTL